MRWFWACSFAVGLTLCSAASFARVPTRLVYMRTPSASDCPDEAALGTAVAARLGYEPFSPWGDQTIVASVTRRGSELVARAELIDHDGIAQGSREVRQAQPDCSELILALALAISITLDPLHVDVAAPAPTPAEPPTEPPSEPPAEPESAAQPTPVREPRRRRDVSPNKTHDRPRHALSWHVAAAVIGTLETTPQLAFGGRFGVSARRDRWALGLEAWSTLPSARSATDGGEVQVRVSSAALVPCFRVWSPFSLCALATLGVTHAEGRAVDAARTENVLYATAGGRALLAFPLGPAFELVANVDALAALDRPRFQLNDSDVWRPGPAAVFVGLGASARFF